MFVGYVDGLQNGRIVGWAGSSVEPGEVVVVEARAAGQVIGRAATNIKRHDTPFGPDAPVGFSIFLDDCSAGGGGPVTVHISGSDQMLQGVPIRVPAPIGSIPRRPLTELEPSRAIDVVVPVYRGVTETLACLQSVLDAEQWQGELVIINDASPEPTMMAEISRIIGGHPRARLLFNQSNRGFPYSANLGMRHSLDRDVILLNSDTLVHGDWVGRLRRAAYSSPDIGTVTALSNEASICSYAGATDADPAHINQFAREVNTGIAVDLPTAVGFCMYIRRDCLDEVGLFDAETFGRGYGEENDFCLRARLFGWRHVAAADVFVAHQGGRSFGTDAAALQLRNGALLERFYPGYDALVQGWLAADPLRLARRRLDVAQLAPADCDAVLLIAPAVEGGIARHLADRRRDLWETGDCAVTLLPAGTGDVRLEIAGQEHLKNLIFSIDSEMHELVDLLKALRVREVQIHHLLGHDPAVADLAKRLSVPMDIIIHDYSWVCPRISLINDKGRFCGQPNEAQCERCAAAPGTRIDLTPIGLRTRSASLFDQARSVIAPSKDAAKRLSYFIPGMLAHITVIPWDKASRAPAPATRSSRRRVCVLGAIGDVKGYDMLLACARDAARRDLPIEFALVGYSQDDIPLLATGRVTITGLFKEEDAVDLVHAADADIALLPSIGPETWSYALSTLWEAGLEVVALDLGAPAERIGAHGGGLGDRFSGNAAAD